MKQIIIICEGHTEQTFVKNQLYPVFLEKGILLQSPLMKASKGGLVKWDSLKKQIETHLKSEREAFVTTFMDYYGMGEKHDFPGWEAASKIVSKPKRMDFLEDAMKQDLEKEIAYRFIPYLQLHEFEGLLFNDIQIIWEQIPDEDLIGKKELQETFLQFDNPEMINNAKETSPSHRLQRIIRGYDKIVHGDILAGAIGLSRMRAKSPRFDAWLSKLEQL